MSGSWKGPPMVRWRKSSRSSYGENSCIELGSTGAVRDSKNPHGPTLTADLPVLIAAVKTDKLRRA